MMDPEGLSKPCSTMLHEVEVLSSVHVNSFACVHQNASIDTDMRAKAWTIHLASRPLHSSTEAPIMLLHGPNFAVLCKLSLQAWMLATHAVGPEHGQDCITESVSLSAAVKPVHLSGSNIV